VFVLFVMAREVGRHRLVMVSFFGTLGFVGDDEVKGGESVTVHLT